MKPQISFFLEDETLQYLIKQSYGKVLHQNNQNVFLFEIESTDDLEHVEGDSLQNNYPEITLTIEDFPIDCKDMEELLNQEIAIPHSVGEIENELDEKVEIYYTNLNLSDEEDLETNDNEISFYMDDENELCILWKGKCDHFQNADEIIPFEVNCKLNYKKEEKDYDE